MADWLVSTGTKTVVMESTGMDWVAAYEVLESRGLEVVLANAREARAVPGRKSDVNDAQWLQRLHACGLLRASFRPGRDIAELRNYAGTCAAAKSTPTMLLPKFSTCKGCLPS
ncbi:MULTISPECIES: transposase [Caballeronia]|uniref:IS110 family transposase n=1 Tax=Caballeronia sp. LZ001 TaxID=3038553 RepID=UPI001FD2664B|nr:transposase [Caballeronia grimmiae]